MRAALGVADRVLLDDGCDLIGDLRRPARDGGALVVVDVLGIDDHVDGGRVVELFELERGELGLSRSTASEHVDLGGLVVLEALIDVGGDLGGQQFVAGLGQHARHIQGDVADTDDRDLLGLERPGAWEVGMPVVPGHELRGAVGAVEVDAGQVHRPVVGGTGGEDDSVVHLLQVFEGDVAAVVDVADQPDLRFVQHLVQRGDDALDARMIRCHAVADQAERCRHPLEQIDRDTTVFGLLRLHQGISGIDAGRTGTDDGHAKRTVLIAHESECLSRSVGGRCRKPGDLPGAGVVDSLPTTVGAGPGRNKKPHPRPGPATSDSAEQCSQATTCRAAGRSGRQPTGWSARSAPTSRFRSAGRGR